MGRSPAKVYVIPSAKSLCLAFQTGQHLANVGLVVDEGSEVTSVSAAQEHDEGLLTLAATSEAH